MEVAGDGTVQMSMGKGLVCLFVCGHTPLVVVVLMRMQPASRGRSSKETHIPPSPSMLVEFQCQARQYPT